MSEDYEALTDAQRKAKIIEGIGELKVVCIEIRDKLGEIKSELVEIKNNTAP